MSVHGSIRKLAAAVPLTVALSAGWASAASAQGRELFAWSGSVDREVRITMRGREAWLDGEDGWREGRGRVQVTTALPRSGGWVDLRVEDGRGEVDVIQQPSARNDYTTIIRIADRSSGDDRYRIRAYWSPDNDGRDGYARGRIGDYGRGRGNDRGDDGWYGRDDRGSEGRDGGRWGDSRGLRTMRWSGSVDDVLQIRLQGGRIQYRTISGRAVRDIRTDMGARGLPRQALDLRVIEREGRGDIRIVQQPSARNGYATIIEIRDPRSGYGRYTFDLAWRPAYGRP
jgi:hypothetical protein